MFQRSYIVILMCLISVLVVGQDEIYSPSPSFIQEHAIKQIVYLNNSAYHVEKNIPPDTIRVDRFNENGALIQTVNYSNNQLYSATKNTVDEANRILRTENYIGNDLRNMAEYQYLPNGDYCVRYFSPNKPENVELYCCQFDANGNEIRQEYRNTDSALIHWDTKTYNKRNKLISRVHQNRAEDTLAHTLYYYKKDTLLVREEYYFNGELSSRNTFEYFPNGKKKVAHYSDQNSWYFRYDEAEKLKKQIIVRRDQKDTLINVYVYNEQGLVSVVRNERDNLQERREVFTYHNGKEQTKLLYVRGDQFNTLFETVYLGDTARVIYQTPHWEKRAFYAIYQRFDPHGNILEERKSEVNGKKQPIDRWMKDAVALQYRYTLSEGGKVLEKYQRFVGWAAEEQMCKTYSDDRILAGLNRREQQRQYASCDTIRTRRFNGGKHYFVSMVGAPHLTRHVYQNKSGIVDSILDINEAGATVNRMIKENDVRVSYTLLNRYEYTDFDSIERVHQCSGRENYSLYENIVEEHVWNGQQKVKEVKNYNHWKHYSDQVTTVATFQYRDGFVYRTTTDQQGKETEHRLKYDENNRLIQVVELNRQSNANLHVDFSYDSDGNLLERSEMYRMSPLETRFQYEFE